MNKAIYYLMILIALFIQTSYGQNQRLIDSLHARLKQDIHDTDRVNTTNNMAWQYISISLDSALFFGKLGLTLASEIEWKNGIADSKGRIGTFHSIGGRFDSALVYYFETLKINQELGLLLRESINYTNIANCYADMSLFQEAVNYYNKALQISRTIENEQRIAINLGNLGTIHYDLGEPTLALNCYFEALGINEHLKRTAGIAIVSGNIGLVYSNQKEFDKALTYLQKAKAINDSTGHRYGLGINLTNIGRVHFQKREYEEALAYYAESKAIGEEMGNLPKIALNIGNMGAVYLNQNDFQGALAAFEEALAIDKKLANRLGISRHLGNLGVLHTKIGNFIDAEKLLTEAILVAKEIQAKENLVDQYSYLSQLYDTTDRPSEAFNAFKQHIIYRDSITNEENTKAQTRTEMKYEYEKAELVAEQLESEATRKEQETTARRDNLQYSIILISLLIVFGGVLSLGVINVSPKVAEGLIFFSFLILFEFLLVLADPTVDKYSEGAPGYKLLFNAVLAGMIFPLHAWFEKVLKRRLVRNI